MCVSIVTYTDEWICSIHPQILLSNPVQASIPPFIEQCVSGVPRSEHVLDTSIFI